MAKRRVAVLGGGVGAMSAAWALASAPGAGELFEIDVYQVGWRLGGKGASGRNAREGQRIEEHGLHVWSGFYENAFRTMRDVFREIGEGDHTFRSVDEAFFPDNNIVLGERTGDGWAGWVVRPVGNDLVPGDGEDDLTPWAMFLRLAAFLREALEALDGDGQATPVPEGDLGLHILGRLSAVGEVAAAAPLRLLQAFASLLPGGTPDGGLDFAGLEHLSRAAQDHIREARERIVGERDEIGEDLKRILQALELGGAALRGMVEDRVFLRGFDAIDGEEISTWLERHGADPACVDGTLVLAVYDYVFGYRGGMTVDQAKAIAAGTFLRGSLRLALTYKGAIFYKMRAGMGDTIFTPFYKALKKKGVRFHFFHRVRAIHPDARGAGVQSIEIDRQVRTKGDYDPFVRVKGLDCWPSEPLWEGIADEDVERARLHPSKGDEAGGHPDMVDLESSWNRWEPAERLRLERGRDFDEVVLGIPVGALPDIAPELIAASPAWKRMVAKVQTVATQAVQLWLTKTTEELGWAHGPSILTAYEDALNTWADMSHLSGVEDWPAGREPRSIAYFCGPLADPAPTRDYGDPGFPARMREQVAAEALEWFRSHGAFIFPGLIGPDGNLRQDLLVATGDRSADRWAGQYVRANVEPSERYVLSVPGSTFARLRADRSGFDNLWLAGDWTYTGINAGCVEAAVMSGMRAAAGLAGVAPRIVGEEEDPIPGGRGPVPPRSSAPVLKTYRPQNSPWPWSALYGMAETTGPCATLAIPREAADAMLPPGLALAPQGLTGPDEHPVILLFGRQRDVRPNVLPWGMADYLEFICAVPFVVREGEAMRPVIWPQRLYLDSEAPIALGVYGYGFPKVRAAITMDDRSYIVRDIRTGAEIVSCGWQATGPRARADALPPFAIVRPAYEMAMVTKRPLGGWQYCVYDFSLDSALLQPLDMEVRVGANDFGLPPGLYRPPSIARAALGGFYLTADGTISNPFQSDDIRRHLIDVPP